jgi:hypothetical protein
MFHLWQGKILQKRYALNGHFQSRRHLWQLGLMSRIVKSNVLAVIWKDGEQFKFSLALDSKYGKGTAEDLLHKARKTLK